MCDRPRHPGGVADAHLHSLTDRGKRFERRTIAVERAEVGPRDHDPAFVSDVLGLLRVL